MDFIIIILVIAHGIFSLSEIYQIQEDNARIITKIEELKKQLTDKK